MTGRRSRFAWPLCAMVALVVHGGVMLCAQEGFAPPSSYPADRYEAEWDKNPFTLKTAPVALQKASFAQDLAIGSYFGASSDPTVIVVNTKTGERLPLRTGGKAPNGMELKSVSIKPVRKETSAVVALSGETAVLRVDETFIRQNAARQDAAKGGAGRSDVPARNAAETAGAAVPPPRTGPMSLDPVQASAAPRTGGANGPAGAAAFASNVPTPARRMRLTMPNPQSKPQPPVSR